MRERHLPLHSIETRQQAVSDVGATVNVPPWTSGTEAERIEQTGAGTEMSPTTDGGEAGAANKELTSAERPRVQTAAEMAPTQGGAQIDRGMVQAAVDVADRR